MDPWHLTAFSTGDECKTNQGFFVPALSQHPPSRLRHNGNQTLLALTRLLTQALSQIVA